MERINYPIWFYVGQENIWSERGGGALQIGDGTEKIRNIKPFIPLDDPFTTCSILVAYVMEPMMQMKSFIMPACLAAGLVVAGLSVPASADQRGRGARGQDQEHNEISRGNSRRFEQDAARRAMLDGDVMPFSIIKRRVGREMDGASYLGSEFDDRRGEYRLKYMREGRVLWVDVDGRSGDIVRRSR